MEWSVTQTGSAHAEEFAADSFRFRLPAGDARQYANAQIDDTAGRKRRHFCWRPPVRLELAARFSHPTDQLRGTAGFGFWNLPLGPGPARFPALPRALWFFFGAQPSNLPLAAGIPGHGWKAASLDAGRPAALFWAPWTPFLLLAMRSKSIYARLWPRIQCALAVSEALVPAGDTEWHQYALEWRPDDAEFWVDGEPLLHVPRSPRGPLGFVAWMDNQYAIATPQGQFGWGLSSLEQPQWLEIAGLTLERQTG